MCFVVGAGVAGVDADGAGQGGGGVEGGDADGVGDQLGLYVQDLLAGAASGPAVALSVKPAQPWAAIAPARAVSFAWSDSP